MTAKNQTNGRQTGPNASGQFQPDAQLLPSIYTHNPGIIEQSSEFFDTETGQALTPEELAKVWNKRAHDLAKEPPQEASGQTHDLLVFRLGNEEYGLNVSNVREIYPLEQLTPVPRTTDFVAGVFSARGRILSVIDLRAFLGLTALGLSDQTKIIVVGNDDLSSDTAQMEIGILADEVADVTTIFTADIEPSLTTHTGTTAAYIEGITADMLVVLNIEAILNEKRLIVQEELI